MQVRRHRREAGQGLTEYAIILSLVAIVAIIALTTVGLSTRSVFERVNCAMQSGGNQQEGCEANETPDECDFYRVAVQCVSGGMNVGGYSRNCDGSTTTAQLSVSGSSTGLIYLGNFPPQGHAFVNNISSNPAICSGTSANMSSISVSLIINTSHSGTSVGYSKTMNAEVSGTP